LFGDDPSVLLPCDTPETGATPRTPEQIPHGTVIPKPRGANENDILFKWRMQRKLEAAAKIQSPRLETQSHRGDHEVQKSSYHTPRSRVNTARRENGHGDTRVVNESVHVSDYVHGDNRRSPMVSARTGVQTQMSNMTIIDHGESPMSFNERLRQMGVVLPQKTRVIVHVVHQGVQTDAPIRRNVGISVQYRHWKPSVASKGISTDGRNTCDAVTQCEAPETFPDDNSDITEVSAVNTTQELLIEKVDCGVQTDEIEPTEEAKKRPIQVPNDLQDDPILQYFAKLQGKVINSLNEVDQFLAETSYVDD